MAVTLHKKKPIGTLSIGGNMMGKVTAMGVNVPMQTSAKFNVMGIDVSTDTGIVVLTYDDGHGVWRIGADFEINLPSLPKTATMKQRTQRCLNLRAEVNGAMIKYKPMAVAIEGYGYANAHSLVTLVEFGSSVRSVLMCLGSGVSLYEVAPAQLKKYVLGKGVGKKEQVMMQVFKRWGYEAKTNNLADAYVLAQMAASLSKLPPVSLTKPQVDVLAAVLAKNA
jgi:crossover junction endodeoxyribonuclease RuvC